MLLKSYTSEIFRPECNPNFTSLHCIARLDQNVGAALPYLNAELGGFAYTREPPSVTFKIRGRLITVHADRIAINSLEDAAEAARLAEGAAAAADCPALTVEAAAALEDYLNRFDFEF